MRPTFSVVSVLLLLAPAARPDVPEPFGMAATLAPFVVHVRVLSDQYVADGTIDVSVRVIKTIAGGDQPALTTIRTSDYPTVFNLGAEYLVLLSSSGTLFEANAYGGTVSVLEVVRGSVRGFECDYNREWSVGDIEHAVARARAEHRDVCDPWRTHRLETRQDRAGTIVVTIVVLLTVAGCLASLLLRSRRRLWVR